MPGLSREMLIPFQVGSDGGIAWTDDRVTQAIQHIVSVVATNIAERAMRPEYGCRLLNALFEPDDPLQQADLHSEMTLALQRWESGINIISIVPESSSSEDAIIQFKISFQLPGDTQLHTALVNVGGSVQETTFSV